ncbi:methyl-accepting chemotaxis protein [bacterium]|nr:methyl-accepting chemotaxis protein [bacterium]
MDIKKRLGTKICGGFGTLILVALLLGSMAVWNMSRVGRESRILNREYIPEVTLANALERNWHGTMLGMRSYALSSDKKYLDESRASLDEVKKNLQKADELGKASTNLGGFVESNTAIQNGVSEYENLAEQSGNKLEEMEKIRGRLKDAAALYVENCGQFHEDQERMLREEMDKGLGAAKLKERLHKLNLVDEVDEMGAEIRTAVLEAEIIRDDAPVLAAAAKFDQINQRLDELQGITRQQVNLDQIRTIRTSLDDYRRETKALTDDWLELTRLTQARTATANAVLESVQAQASQGLERTVKVADLADTSLHSSSFIMVIGLVAALVVGLVLAWKLTCMITRPVGELTRIAGSIAEGDLSEKIDIQREDEVGMLADSFRKMQQALNDKALASEHIANGDLSVEVRVASERDVLGKAMVRMVESLKAMNSEVSGLTRAALKGDLDVRAETGRHRGEYSSIIKGINDLLEAIVNPIREAAAVLAAASDKDLTNRVNGTFSGQLDEFKNNINSTIGSLGEALVQVSEAVEQVNAASTQISSGSQSLAQGANEQASALEEISASLEQMSSMTRQNADNAHQAKELSLDSRQSAEEGQRAMQKMVEAIDRIKASSDETAKIVKTIDEIAFQTNLLALNAAVEAARAGDAGKGFAVVAEEVRSLAQRSAEAAKNTAQMIDDSVRNAENGVNITSEVASALGKIAASASKTNELISEIASAAKEQSQGIEQVNVAVSRLDEVTQSNASNSEESASAAEELNSQSSELHHMLAEFKLDWNGDANARQGSPQRRPRESKNGMQAANRLPEAAVETAGQARPVPGTLVKAPKNGNGGGKNGNGGGSNGNGGLKSAARALIPLNEEDFKNF